jgi:hypothetical protein
VTREGCRRGSAGIDIRILAGLMARAGGEMVNVPWFGVRGSSWKAAA